MGRIVTFPAHIALLNVFFAPHSYGGATVVAEQVARELVQTHGRRVSAIDEGDGIASERLEQAPLGGEIGLRRAVVIQMVARDVRQRDDVEIDARHPMLIQRVGGDLHHHVRPPCRDGPGHQGRQVNRIGRGGGGGRGGEDVVGVQRDAAKAKVKAKKNYVDFMRSVVASR